MRRGGPGRRGEFRCAGRGWDGGGGGWPRSSSSSPGGLRRGAAETRGPAPPLLLPLLPPSAAGPLPALPPLRPSHRRGGRTPPRRPLPRAAPRRSPCASRSPHPPRRPPGGLPLSGAPLLPTAPPFPLRSSLSPLPRSAPRSPPFLGRFGQPGARCGPPDPFPTTAALGPPAAVISIHAPSTPFPPPLFSSVSTPRPHSFLVGPPVPLRHSAFPCECPLPLRGT